MDWRHDGRSPDLRILAERRLPGFPVAGGLIRQDVSLSAHSCGGSHGFGPDWVVRTVFPIIPWTPSVGKPSRHIFDVA